MKNLEKNAFKMALEIIKIQGKYGFDVYKNIQYKDGFCNITDGRILLTTNLFYDINHEGKSIDPKNLKTMSYGKFPDTKKLYESIIGHNIVKESLEIPKFIFNLGSFNKHDICLLYLCNDGDFTIEKTEKTVAGLDMRYMKMLKFLYPLLPKIKAKDDKSAVIFEYGEPIHTTVLIMPVKI